MTLGNWYDKFFGDIFGTPKTIPCSRMASNAYPNRNACHRPIIYTHTIHGSGRFTGSFMIYTIKKQPFMDR